MIEMSEASVEVMEVIREDNSSNSIYDDQIIRELKDTLVKIKT
jgi:hypothetical protein